MLSQIALRALPRTTALRLGHSFRPFFSSGPALESNKKKGQGDSGGWPSTTGNPSGGGRSNNKNSSTNMKKVEALIEKQNQHLASMNEVFSKHAKLQQLAFAIENVSVNSFAYSSAYSSGIGGKDSADLVKSILLRFRTGAGRYLPDVTLEDHEDRKTPERWDESRNDFHDALINQIHELTGTKPRIIKMDDGRYSIWYE